MKTTIKVNFFCFGLDLAHQLYEGTNYLSL
jgi:hypothetical protein